LNIVDLQDYKRNKSEEEFKKECENIVECLAEGAPGLHDLVQSYELTDDRKYSLGSYLEMVQNVFKKDPMDLFYDAAKMDEDAFYDKHELNWWITIDEMLTFLAMMKESNYSTYARIVIETMEEI
jgi:hypothetical protein